MGRIAFCGPTYQSQTVSADAQACRNMFLERDESGAGKSEWQLINSPGSKTFADLSQSLPLGATQGPYGCLCTITVPNGDLYAMYNMVSSGQNVVNIVKVNSDGTQLTVATLSGQGWFTVPVSFAISSQYVAFISPNGSVIYYWDHTAAYPQVLGAATISGSPILTQIVFLDGYFLVLKSASSQVYYSLDVTTWNAADTFQVSITADYVNSMIVDHRELILTGDIDTVAYYNSGDSLNPFMPNPAGFIQNGNAAAKSLIRLDNTVFFIAKNEQGQGIGVRLQGYLPTRVTTYAVEAAWNSYSTIADAVSYSFVMEGHTFWHIYFPTANKSWRYDVSTGMWHEVDHLRTSDGTLEAHRSWTHAFAFGKHLVGDWQTGTIYEMALPVADGNGGWTFCDDFGGKIKRLRRSPYIFNDNERIPIDKLELFLDTGLGPIPPFGENSPSYAAPTLTQGAGNLAAGTWSIQIYERDINTTTLIAYSQIATMVLGSPHAITITLPDNTAGKWRVYISNDDFATGFALDVDTSLFQVTANILSSPWFADTPPIIDPRGPQVMLAISKDNGRNFVPYTSRDAGQAGEYTKRVFWNKLGMARSWSFEISMTDAVPWRIVDANIEPDYPASRLSPRLRQQA